MKQRSQTESPLEALAAAVTAAGGDTNLARCIGEVCLPLPPTSAKGSGHVSQWKRRGKCPPDQVLRIEAATGVSRHRLRPDVFGYEAVMPPEGVAARVDSIAPPSGMRQPVGGLSAPRSAAADGSATAKGTPARLPARDECPALDAEGASAEGAVP